MNNASNDRMSNEMSITLSLSFIRPSIPKGGQIRKTVLSSVLTGEQERCTNNDYYQVTRIPYVHGVENGSSIHEFAELVICECSKPDVEDDLKRSDVISIICQG